MAKKVFSKANLKKFLSVSLALIVLVCSSFITIGVTAAESEDAVTDTVTTDQVASIRVKGSNYSPVFGQAVYLEPETTYTFSYKYSTERADDPFIRYYTSDTAGTAYKPTGPVYDTYYNMVTYTFTTVSLDTTGIITDDAGELIKHFVGIRSNFKGTVGTSDPKYSEYDFVFGDFQLLKNGEGDNCFADPLMTSMQTAVNRTDLIWGAMDRTSNVQITSHYYERYYVDGTNYPTRDFFVSGPKDEVIKLKALDSTGPYLVQRVWLKPATTYIFSYYYDTTKASKFVYYNPGKESNACSNVTESYDAIWNKVYYEFTTVDVDHENATVSDDGTMVQAVIGLRNYNNNTVKTGSYFAGFDLYEKADATKTNCLIDTKFSSVGSYNNGHNWTSWWNGTLTSNYYEKVRYDKNATNDMFKRSNEIVIDTYDNGTVTSSETAAIEGQTVTFDVQPAEGYELLELCANGKPIPCANGVYSMEFSSYYTDLATGKIAISAKFIKQGTIPCITPTVINVARAIIQDVWLEPDTEYVFNYKYNVDPASHENIGCYNASGEKVALTLSDKTYDNDEYKSVSRYFRTPVITDDVTVGSGQNEGLIKCYVGLYFAADWASTAEDGISLMGAPTCYKVIDENKNNLLTSLDFSSMNQDNSGVWHSHWAILANQVCTRYDADSETEGTQDPSDESFKIDLTDKVILLTSIDRPRENPFLVQELYLKPDTTYVFSYYYSNSVANDAYVGNGYTDKQFTKSAPIFDANWKKVSYEFTTTPTSESVFDEYGRILTVVGLKFHTEIAEPLLGTYFADMDLYAKDDATMTDLFRDNQYKSIGVKGGNVHHAYWDGFYAIDTMAKVTDVAADLFIRVMGDCNEDNQINIIDLVCLKKNVANSSNDIITANADMDLNGALDSLDLKELRIALLNG